MIIKIAGCPDSRPYILAIAMAKFLRSQLPSFDFVGIPRLSEGWIEYRNNLNKATGWTLIEQPIIWKELYNGGKKHAIGGLSEFFEYCYAYYGIQLHLLKFTEEELQQLKFQSLEEYQKSKQMAQRYDTEAKYLEVTESDVQKMVLQQLIDYQWDEITYLNPNRKIISILGGAHEITWYLIEEIIGLQCLHNDSGIEIRLFDQNCDKNDSKEMKNMIYSFNSQGIYGNKAFVRPVKTLGAAISDCDLLICTIDFKMAKEGQYARHNVFLRIIIEAEKIAKSLDKYAKRALRIVVLNYNISNCFFANYLTKHAKTINSKNIVVPTSYSGLKLINLISKKTGIQTTNLSAPPIWGADDINMYFDMRAILYKGHVCKPFKRSLTSPANSTLPLGVVETELRYLSHLISDEESIMKEYQEVVRRKKLILRFPTIFSKIRCIMDILRIWFEEDSESIISLGVASNGTFGLPHGLVLSQPCYLKKGYFVPCSEYPVSQETLKKVEKIASEFSEIIRPYISELIKSNDN